MGLSANVSWWVKKKSVSVLTNTVPIHSQYGWCTVRMRHVNVKRMAGGWGQEGRMSKGGSGGYQWGKIGGQWRKQIGASGRRVFGERRRWYHRAGSILESERTTQIAGEWSTHQ